MTQAFLRHVSIVNHNLVARASFLYERKAKKRPQNTSNTGSKFAQIEGIFLRINHKYVCGDTENICIFSPKSLYV